MLASAAAGLSQNPGMLIVCRVVQGIGVGGLSALAQIVMAAMISPRERGRYSGYLGATFAVATVGGPLLGGVITDNLLARLALVLLRRCAHSRSSR
ncbi:MFS transporter [Streptomyces sp. PG2]